MTSLPSDTIAAIATPPGEGGISLIRISGRAAIEVGDRVFRRAGSASYRLCQAETHTVHYGHVVFESVPLDEVLVTVLRAPRTFTVEDTVEIACHGGVRVTGMVLDAVLASGARLAAPGEFTQRAFLNGRIDLAQAEAVADLIHARTRRAVASAREQLAGGLSRKVERISGELMRVLAHLEAHIDFPEEDIQPETGGAMCLQLEAAEREIGALLQTAGEGRILRQGVRAVILGRPNSGKSSLLNRLLDHDRAIVSAVPGTTRDTLEEWVEIRGLPVVLIDTAGLRETSDALEAEGIRRSRAALEGAELVVWVIDGSQELDPAETRLISETGGQPRVVVVNKSDLPGRVLLPEGITPVPVSCLSGDGIEALKDAIESMIGTVRGGEETSGVAINARHSDALRRSAAGIRVAMTALRTGIPPDLVAVDLRMAVTAIGEVCGRTTTEDLLDLIFSEFCLGK